MIFIDANIFMYAAGSDSPQKKPCEKILRQLLKKPEKFCINTEVLQEILHRYISLNREEIGFKIFDSIISLCIPILLVQLEDLIEAKKILMTGAPVSTRDAIHAAVMKNHAIEKVLSYDQGFSAFDFIDRIEP